MRVDARSLLMDFRSRRDASEATASLAATALETGLTEHGKASMFVSGGSTPETAFRILSEVELDWRSVTIGLVDERFVPPNHEVSNEGFVRRTLLQGAAASANFIPMWQDTTDPKQAADTSNKNYTGELPADFVLFGMGTDGHVASWFPDSSELTDALRYTAPSVISVESSGASGTPSRLTLTRKPVSTARHGVLLIFGEEKRDVFISSLTMPEQDRPVRALVDGLGDRLTVVWAP